MPALRVWAYRVWDYIAMCKCRDYLVFSYSVGLTDYFFLVPPFQPKENRKGNEDDHCIKDDFFCHDG